MMDWHDLLHGAGLALCGLSLLLAVLLCWGPSRTLLTRLAQRMTPESIHLAQMARRTTDAIVVTNAARRITWVNEAFERLTGYGAAEAKGQSPGRLLQFDGTDPLTVKRMRLALDAGEPFNGEVLNRSKHGRIYWLELKINPLFDEQGHLSGFMALQYDITERKQAEAALRGSEALLDKTGRIGGVGGWAYDLATHRMHWSNQTYRLMERDPNWQPTLEDCLAHCLPESRQTIEAAIAEALADAQAHVQPERFSWDFELCLYSATGRVFWVRATAELEFSDSGPVRVVGALQDITARRELKAELRRHIDLLRGAIDTIDEAFVLYDPDDRLVFCNDKYRDLYDTSRDAIVPGARFEDIIRTGAERGQYPAAIGRVDEWVAGRLAAHREANRTLVQRLDNGRVLRIVERCMPDGHRVGFRVDITDLVRATDAAERADRAKSEFIATISHELRTPLQSIIGFSDLGRHFARGQVPFEEMFEDIHQGGQRMLRLVNGLLDVSKIDGTQGSLALKRGDVARLAAEVAHELGPLAAQRRLTLALPEPLPVLWADVDAFRLQQVIRNVLANAIRFAPEGSTIEIQGHDLDRAGVTLTVRDHGPGIPEGEIETIFEALVQSSRTRDGSGGTGLGLTISRKIMQAHGGSIEASCPAHSGTLITLSLPPAAATGEARAAKSLRAVRLALEQAAPQPTTEHADA